MRTTPTYRYWLLLAGLLWQFYSMEVAAQDCKKLLLDYIKKSKSYYTKPDSVKVYCIEMVTDVVFAPQTGKQSSATETKMYFQGDKLMYQSNYISMYMDKENTFTIIHPQKTILWTKGKVEADKLNEMMANTIQDTLFRYSSVASCVDAKEPSGKMMKVITLVPFKGSKLLASVQSVVYYYDSKDERLYRSEIYYKAKNSKIREFTTYKTVDYDYKKKKMFETAKREVVDSNGKLLASWNGFELIDQRMAK